MRKVEVLVLVVGLPLAIGVALCLVFLLPSTTLEEEAKHPNILFILLDDAGFNDVGFRNQDIKTPNIDAVSRKTRVASQIGQQRSEEKEGPPILGRAKSSDKIFTCAHLYM